MIYEFFISLVHAGILSLFLRVIPQHRCAEGEADDIIFGLAAGLAVEALVSLLEVGGGEDLEAAAAGAADQRVHRPLVSAYRAEEGEVVE